MCPLQPTRDNLVIELSEAPKASPGGILLPDNAKQKIHRGTVVARGPGKRVEFGDGFAGYDKQTTIDHGIGVGQEVVYREYAGSDVEVGGKVYRVISANDVLAVVVPAAGEKSRK